MVNTVATLKGYAFTCIQCGCCCYQAGGVDMTEKERKEIGQHPSIVPLKGNHSLYKFRIRPLDNGKCPFLENNLCTIYEKRPEICRRFPLTMRYVPDIGYLYGTIICCGVEMKNESSFPFEGYAETLDRQFLSHFEMLEKRGYETSRILSRSVRAKPLVTDIETVIKVWDFVGDLAFADILHKVPLQWMSWVIMKVWYQFCSDVLQKEKVLTGETISGAISPLKELFPEYAKSQLDQLEEAKEKAAYSSAQTGKNSLCTFYTCKKNLKILKIPLSDEERSYAELTEEALELSRNYYSFLAKRNVRATPFRSFVVPIAFVPEILHRIAVDVTELAVLMAKHRTCSIIRGEDLFDVIKLADDPYKFDFYRRKVLESHGLLL